MHHAKNRGNKEIPLAIVSRILAQSCITLCLNYVGSVTRGCASILDSIAKGISLFPRFFAWCIPTSIFIQIMIFTFVPHISRGSRINAAIIIKMYYVIGASVSSLHRESTDSLIRSYIRV